MDENINENIPYKFKLKKIVNEALSTDRNSEIHSDPLVMNLDCLSPASSPKLHEDKGDKDLSYSVLYGKITDEDKLIEEDVNLYKDLIELEEKEKKAREIHEAEFEKCKKELGKLKKVVAEDRTKIDELKKENENLKKSLSSLYQTAKKEVEFKDRLLAEANNKIVRLENFLFRRNGATFANEKCSNCENYLIDSIKGSKTFKRKRSQSPEPSSKKREFKSSSSKTDETDSRSQKDKRRSEKTSEHKIMKNSSKSELGNIKDKKDTFHTSKIAKHNKETQTSNECIFCQSYQNFSATKISEDFKKTNDVFFSLLPDSLKKSFYEYKQDQIVSLSKLQEAFVDEYFSSVDNVPSPILQSTPIREYSQVEHLRSSKSSENKSSSNTTSTSTSSSENKSSSNATSTRTSSSENKSSSNTASTSTSSSEHHKETESAKRVGKDDNAFEVKKDSNKSGDSKVVKTRSVTESNKKDLISLFMYRKEKIPFEEKKKFGLHKSDKKLIPKKLL